MTAPDMVLVELPRNTVENYARVINGQLLHEACRAALDAERPTPPAEPRYVVRTSDFNAWIADMSRGGSCQWSHHFDTYPDAVAEAEAEAARLNAAQAPTPVQVLDGLPEGTIIAGAVDGKRYVWVRNGRWWAMRGVDWTVSDVLRRVTEGTLRLQYDGEVLA